MPASKNFRLNDELRKQFEKVCRENLFDERSVVEAWILQFIDAGTDRRQAVAKRYAEWLSAQNEEVGEPLKPSKSKTKK